MVRRIEVSGKELCFGAGREVLFGESGRIVFFRYMAGFSLCFLCLYWGEFGRDEFY